MYSQKGLRGILGAPRPHFEKNYFIVSFFTFCVSLCFSAFIPLSLSCPSPSLSPSLSLSSPLPVNHPLSHGLTQVCFCVHALLCRWGPLRSLCPGPSFWGVWHHEATRPGGGASIPAADRSPGWRPASSQRYASCDSDSARCQ